ncbi:MAG: CHAT domain-containing protein [Roseiflexaceae bacterium]
MLGLNSLAQAHWFQGRYDRALVLYQQVHALASKIGNPLYQGFALLNMSLVYHEIGYYDQALNFSMQSLYIFRDLHDYYREAHALYEVGHNAMLLGRWHDARGYFQEAIKLHESLKVMAGLGDLYWSQGFLHHMLGEESQSKAAYLQALDIAQSPVHGTPTAIMDVLLFLGFLYQTQGRWDDALDAYAKSFDLASQVRNQHWSSIIHYRRGNIFERQGHTDDALAAYQQAIDGIESLRSETETEEIKIGLLGTTQQVYESIVLLCLAQGRPDAAFDYVERARSRAFLDVLAKKSPELYDTFAQPVATLAEVQAGLPPGALLLEYYTTGVLPRGESLINQIPPENARLREHLTQPPHIYIFAVTRDHFEVHHAPLDPNILRPPLGDPSPIRRLLRGRLPAQLYDALLAPVAHLLRECDLLYLIPHGPLHYVPFAALRATPASPLHHGADPAIALAPSVTVLLRSCLGRPPAGARATHASPLLALGYNDPAGDTPLRYAEAEAGHIARMLGGEALVGPTPKRERLFDAGRQARWLHIASHAIYHPRDSLESELRTGDGESLSARTIIAGLELDADLVTLSACTSGVSQVVAGDELLGLQRAFLYAGARAVLCTLWEAADFVALLLMDRFYADLHRGRRPAAALRDAQAALRAMTGRDVAATIERWRADDPAFVAALGELPAIPPEEFDTLLYADPIWWAPFTLIGKAD